MSITLAYNGITIDISDRLDWTDEFEWTPIEQASIHGTTGALLVDVAVKQAGRPITLVGTDTKAWLKRSTCDTLQAWAALPRAEFVLTVRSGQHTVIFDHAKGGFSARPIWKLLDGHIAPDLDYLPTFRFLEI